MSVGSALLTQIFGYVTPLLGLSLVGLKNIFLWQAVTFLFVAPIPLSLSLVFYLGIALYLLWAVGQMVLDRVGDKAFLRFFFITGVVAGLGAVGLCSLWGIGGILLGPACALYGLLTVWCMFDPNMQMLLFMIFPVRAKWMVVGLLGINLLLDIGSGSYLYVTANLLGGLIGHLYGLLAWDLRGPFTITHPIDHFIARIGRKFRPKSRAQSRIHRLHPF